jgi:hypothetical protein
MRYLLLVYGNEQQMTSMTPEATAALVAQYNVYTQELIDAGVLRGGDELQPTFTATTLRAHDGKVHTTDGPFAETKEQLGGYYMIETETLDEAIAWASKCPAVHGGSVEVRPIVAQPASVDAGAEAGVSATV